ncbi:MAG: c-type cytochrome [Vicinamibacterales bacterium]
MKRLTALGIVLAAGITSTTADAQMPTEFTNLQVLPKTITRAELSTVMRGIATELGLRCHNCHVGPPDLKGMNFATDEKRSKQVARTMMAMTRAINEQYVSTIPAGAEPRQPVRCITCHRRATKPTRPLWDIVVETAVASGAPAAIERHKTISDEFYGSGLYDFREHTLNIAGNKLRDERKMPAEALALFTRNAELFPKSANAMFAVGQAAQEAGNLAGAREFYRKTLAIDPAHSGALNALETIKH